MPSWVELSLVDVKSSLKLSWNNLLSKKFCGRKSWVKTFKVWKILVANKWVPKKCWVKNILGQKKYGLKSFGPKLYCVPNILSLKKFGVKKNFGSKKLRPQQNWVRNNWTIHDMKKSCQHKYCLYKCHGDIWNQRWSQDPTFKVGLKSCQYQLRYSWYGQMSPGQILPERMSL